MFPHTFFEWNLHNRPVDFLSLRNTSNIFLIDIIYHPAIVLQLLASTRGGMKEMEEGAVLPFPVTHPANFGSR